MPGEQHHPEQLGAYHETLAVAMAAFAYGIQDVFCEKIDLLESSGSQILDKEVFRTLKALGPIGGFPKSYHKEHFYLIAFFQYGISQGAARSLR